MIMRKSLLVSVIIAAGALLLACQPETPEKEKKPEKDKEKQEEVDYTPKPGTYTFVMPDYTVKSGVS